MASIHKKRLPSGEIVWELTHGTGRDRKRFVAGKTRPEANIVLRQFEDQLTLHGEAPEGLSVSEAIGRYLAFLKTIAVEVRCAGRGCSLTLNRCFLKTYHADVERLRDVRPMHLESYKQRRSSGEIVEAEPDANREREHALRERQQQHPHSDSEKMPYGWLEREEDSTKRSHHGPSTTS